MKFIRFLIAIVIIILVILCILKLKNSFFNTLNVKNLTEGFGSIMSDVDIKGINSGDIQNSLSGKLDEAKGLAEQYYNDVLKEYVNKTKAGVSGAIEDAKGYYNQGIDDLGETITNKINNKVAEGLDKIKVK